MSHTDFFLLLLSTPSDNRTSLALLEISHNYCRIYANPSHSLDFLLIVKKIVSAHIANYNKIKKTVRACISASLPRAERLPPELSSERVMHCIRHNNLSFLSAFLSPSACAVAVSLDFLLIHVVMSGNLKQQLIVAIAAMRLRFASRVSSKRYLTIATLTHAMCRLPSVPIFLLYTQLGCDVMLNWLLSIRKRAMCSV